VFPLPGCDNNQEEAGGIESKDEIRSREEDQQTTQHWTDNPCDAELQTAQVAAEGRSPSETTWRTSDAQAGALMANPTPMRNTPPRMR
jgi:hypothetical protein